MDASNLLILIACVVGVLFLLNILAPSCPQRSGFTPPGSVMQFAFSGHNRPTSSMRIDYDDYEN